MGDSLRQVDLKLEYTRFCKADKFSPSTAEIIVEHISPFRGRT